MLSLITSSTKPYTVEVTYKKQFSSTDYAELTSITIPATVTYNGKTYSVTSIGACAFYDCNSLTSITIPNSVTSIGNRAFYNCESLTSITIPNSVTSIDWQAFCYCTGLTTVTIGNGVTNIEGVMSIGSEAFAECANLTSVAIGNCVKTMYRRAFYRCKNLTSIIIPNSVTSIGDEAFDGCTDLNSVTIGKNIRSIGDEAFSGCYKITQTNYTGDIAGWCAISFASPYANPIYYSRNLYINGAEITDLIIPDGVTSIGQSAFRGCTGLTSVTIPNSVTSIGTSAFNGCIGLTSVTIPNSVTSIGDYAFYGCTGLTSITIPNSVTSIRDDAFEGCTGLTQTNYTGDIAGWCAISFGDIGANPICYSHNLYINGTEITDLVIPDSVTSIGDYAFSGCKGLTSVTIPNSVTSIGNRVFLRCTGITSVVVESGNTIYDSRDNCNAIIETATNTLIQGCNTTIIPNSVTSIGTSAFDGCTGLTSVTIGNSVTSIENRAFYGCTSLTSISIPNSVTSIGSSAFYNVPNIVYNGTATGSPWSAENVNCYADGYLVYKDASKTILLACSSAATDITIPNSVTSINQWTFRYGKGLTHVTWNVKAYQDIAYRKTPFVYIRSYNDTVFDIRKQITSFSFGEDVESIPAYLCDGMTNIEYIRTEATTPPVVGYNSLNNVPRDIPVYVPCGTKTAYQNADGWNGFHNFMEPAPEFNYTINTRSANQEQGNVTITNEVKCENRVTIEATANPHYHFTQWSDGNTDNPRTLILTQDTTCIAEFAVDEYIVSALPNIAEYGNVSGSGTYKYQSEVLLIAKPNTYYRFTKWSDGKTTNQRKIVVTQDTTFTAEFAPKQYSITASGEHGTVEGTGTYDYNTKVYLTAVPDKGYHFVKWNNGKTYNPYYIYVRSDAHYTAEFAPNQYTITTYAQNGNVSGGGTYDYGTTATLTATADEHYYFTQWSDGNTDNPRTISVEGDATYTAEFKPDSYTITVSAGEHGNVSGGGTYDYGTTATLTATADAHYHFTQWSDGNTDNPRTVSVEGDAAYTAEFAIDQHIITTNAQNGTITGGGTYDYGTTTTLTATADEHYHFTQWSDGSTDNPRTITVEGDATYTAEFAIDQHTITATCDPQQGTVTGAGTYDYGTQVTLTVIANKGYEFAQWSNGVTDNPYLLTATEDLTLEAQFVPTTAVENVSADGDTDVRKVFRNGQVYILRNGKIYTITGQDLTSDSPNDLPNDLPNPSKGGACRVAAIIWYGYDVSTACLRSGYCQGTTWSAE